MQFTANSTMCRMIEISLDTTTGAAGCTQPVAQVCSAESSPITSASPQADSHSNICAQVRANEFQLPPESRSRPRAERGGEAAHTTQARAQGCHPRVAQRRAFPGVRAAEEAEGKGPGIQRSYEACLRFDRVRAGRGEGDGAREVKGEETGRAQVDRYWIYVVDVHPFTVQSSPIFLGHTDIPFPENIMHPSFKLRESAR